MNSSPSTDTIASASNLGGESAIVTGGSRGIGAAIVKALVGARATVVIAGGSEKHGRDLAADLGGRYLPHDVSSEQSWRHSSPVSGMTWATSRFWSTTLDCSIRVTTSAKLA